MHMGFSRIVASALFGAVLLLASGAAAQVPGGVVIKPPFVNGNCVKAVAPGAITTAGNGPCGGGTGTVTSVDVSGGTTGLTFSGGPVTTTGTITMGGGPLTVPFGGTGAASWTAHGLILGNGSSALGITAAGTTGQYLKGVTGADPAWGTISSDLVSSISMGSTGLTPNSATTGAVTVAGTLDVDNGGTGQTSYTNGQLLIGNTSGNTLTKATLTAGTNVTITNGNGSITIAASGGGGTGCTTSGTAGFLLTDDGAGGCTSNPGARYATGVVTAGTAGSLVGGFALQNATSGTITLAPPAGALGTVTVTVPAATDTLVNLASSQVLTNKTIAFASNTLTGVAPLASPTFTGTVTGPDSGTWTSAGFSTAHITASTDFKLSSSTALTSASGTGAILVTSTGAQTNGRCVTIDANGNHVAAAAACAAGSVTSVDVSGGTTGLTTSGGPVTSSGTITLAGTLAVANGGTGQTSYTNGQLLIGNTTGNTLAKATITAGTGISVTNGAGSITIAATGTAPAAPLVKTGNFTAAANGQYCVDTTGGAVTATLPASPANGDTIAFWDCLQRFAVASLILGRASLTIMNSATDMTVSTNNANFHVTYVSDGSVTTWIKW